MWFFLGVIAMGLLLYAGFLLMSGQGDEAKLKKAHNIFMYAVGGLLIVIFSALVIKLVAGLF